MGAAGAGYEGTVMVAEVVLDDYEDHVAGAASLAVDVSYSCGAGEDIAGADGEEGLDPLAGHVDGAFEAEVEVGGFLEADEGADKGGRGNYVAVGTFGCSFLINEERVGLANGAGEAQYHFPGDGMRSPVEAPSNDFPVEFEGVLGVGLGGSQRMLGAPSRGP